MLPETARNDYARVYVALKMLTNDKAPDWAILIYYILMLPLGLMLYPLVKLVSWLVIKYYDL
jgi:hypothetical protein